jgi:hypothetical protein
MNKHKSSDEAIKLIASWTGKYFLFSLKGFKKLFKSKLKTKRSRIITVIWSIILVASLLGILVNPNVKKILLGIPFLIITLPTLNLIDFFIPSRLQGKFIKHNVYERMGINDYKPTLLYTKNNNNITTYTFNSQGNKLNNFESSTDLLEYSLSEFSKKYCKIIQIKKKDTDNRFFEVITANKALINYYIWSENLISEYINSNKLFIGISYFGNLTIDFSRTPHLFIAGETDSGKGNVTKNILIQLLYKSIYQNLNIVVIDFKAGLDYTPFDGIFDVYTNKKDLAKLLSNVIGEMERRNNLMKSAKVENIDEYNKISNNKLNRFYIISDEAVDAIPDNKKENTVKDDLTELARKSRACGIHLVLTTQLPTTSIFGNQLKNNVPGRLCGRFADESASRIVLGNTRATKLPETKGRMLYKIGANMYEVQTPKVSNNLISHFVKNNRDKFHITKNNFQSSKKINLDKNETFNNLEDIKKIKVKKT